MKQFLIIPFLLSGFFTTAQTETEKDTISLNYQLEGVTINGKATWKKGDKILLQNLIFRGGTSFLEVSSKPLLDELLRVCRTIQI